MKKNILASIIISTRNKSWKTVSKSLDSILSSNFKDFEIILIDQNNNKEIKLRIKSDKKYNNILYLKSKSIGLSRGRNLGVKHSNGKWLLFFDDDAIIQENFFEKIENDLRKNKDKPIMFYGNVLNIEDKKFYIKRTIRTPFLSFFNFDTVCSIGLLFNRKVIKEIGNFDVDFGAGSKFKAGEETDLIIRALKKKYKIRYLKNFVVYHPKSEIKLLKKYSYGYGLGALYKKHIFNSFKCFLALGIKFIWEIVIRTILGIFFLCINFQKAQLHFNYLKGFVKGFMFYNKNENSSSK